MNMPLGLIDIDNNMAGGYFETSKLVFRQAAQQFVIEP